MKINQTKTDEDINKYFQAEVKRIVESYGFSQIEMLSIDRYATDRQRLLDKCGTRMRFIRDKK